MHIEVRPLKVYDDDDDDDEDEDYLLQGGLWGTSYTDVMLANTHKHGDYALLKVLFFLS